MTKRGPKPGSVQEGSLVSKLLNIRVGETIYLDDRHSEGIATNMERQVTNMVAKSPALSGRKFTTERWVAIRTGPTRTREILGVTRQPDETA